MVDDLLTLGRRGHLDDGERHPLALVGQGRVGGSQLQRGDPQAIAERQGRPLDVGPAAALGQHAAALSHQATAGIHAEADHAEGVDHLLGRHPQRDTRHADVGGVAQYVVQVGRLVNAHVADLLGPDEQGTTGYGVLPAGDARLQGAQQDQRLDGRTRLVGVRHHPVAHPEALVLATVVRVVGGGIDHGEHFAGLHIQHHHGAGGRLVLVGGALEGTVGQRLHPLIYAQLQIVGVLALLDQPEPLDDPALPVLAHPHLARGRGQPFVVAALYPLDAAAVYVGHPHQVGADLAGRVETARLGAQVDAPQLQTLDVFRHGRRDLTLQIDEALAGVGDAVLEGVDVELEHGGERQPGALVVDGAGLVHRLGIGPDRLDRHRDRQLLAVAVGDHAAHRLGGGGAQGAHVPLLAQPVRIYHLDPGQPQDQAGKRNPDEKHQGAKAPRVE